MSIKPGQTIWPEQSSEGASMDARSPIAAMVPASIPTSMRRLLAPLPSMTRPPRRITSIVRSALLLSEFIVRLFAAKHPNGYGREPGDSQRRRAARAEHVVRNDDRERQAT